MQRRRRTFLPEIKTCTKTPIQLPLAKTTTHIHLPPFPPPQLQPHPHLTSRPPGCRPLPTSSPPRSSPPTQSVNQRPTTSTSAWWWSTCPTPPTSPSTSARRWRRRCWASSSSRSLRSTSSLSQTRAAFTQCAGSLASCWPSRSQSKPR